MLLLHCQHQLTTGGTRRFYLRIDPAYQRAYSNALKRWYGGASCDTVRTKIVEEHNGYGNNLADP